MNPLDYGVWSILQEKVWADNCATLLQLKSSVQKHMMEIKDERIQACIRAFEKRVRLCNEEGGGYFEYKLKKKVKA